MNLWEKYQVSFREHASETAFCINGKFYTYSNFSTYISGSQHLLLQQLNGKSGCPIGVMCHDSIETFAAIFAVWFSGCQFVPLHPLHPDIVNQEKIHQAKLDYIFSSEVIPAENSLNSKVILNKEITSSHPLLVSQEQAEAYILFTSGSTGKPKGVTISQKNLTAFIDGFIELYPDLNKQDRFLQTYDLTSDAAFTGYLIPLLIGATVFTIPSGSFKYLSIIKLIQEHQITWTKFTPSVLNYLRPYFGSIRLDTLKHSHFGGEALTFDLVEQWAKCVPNAELSNGYGPTETTITCTIHRTSINQLAEKVYNGILSIGKPFKSVKIRIVDENDQIVDVGHKGELCIGGAQVMNGYLNSPDQNKPFLIIENKDSVEKFYRTGDLAISDQEGFLFFCGRKDDQLKISGYRVEPAEIELAVSRVTNGCRSKAYGFRNKNGVGSIVVFIEQYSEQPEKLKDLLRGVLPSAFIPEKIISVRQFPINANGKIDKTFLFEKYSSQIYE